MFDFSCLSFILSAWRTKKVFFFTFALLFLFSGWKMMRMIIICEDGKRKSQVRFMYFFRWRIFEARERRGAMTIHGNLHVVALI
jgi:hypothetical protein